MPIWEVLKGNWLVIVAILIIAFSLRKKKTREGLKTVSTRKFRTLKSREVDLMFVDPGFMIYEDKIISAKRDIDDPSKVVVDNGAWNLDGLIPLRREKDGKELYMVTRDNYQGEQASFEKLGLNGKDKTKIPLCETLQLKIEGKVIDSNNPEEVEMNQPHSYKIVSDEKIMRNAFATLQLDKMQIFMFGSMGIVVWETFKFLFNFFIRVSEARAG